MDRCDGCQHNKKGKCEAASPSDCANKDGSIYTTIFGLGKKIFARNDKEFLDIAELMKHSMKNKICANCGKPATHMFYLQAIARVNGKTVIGNTLDMCSEKCCDEYAKEFEKESAFLKSVVKSETSPIEQTILNKERL